jgi:probable F420-dependent oxidoreductase
MDGPKRPASGARSSYDAPMEYGLCLPNTGAIASADLIDAAASLADRRGWTTVWTTDHVLADRANESDYGQVFEALQTLAWIGARYPRLRLGTSVIVVPQRNAVLLAKELATLDALSGGRVIAGVGVGWLEVEFANLGLRDRFHVRGAYVDEAIRLWRHLWSGSSEPFAGRFHSFDDFVFGPLPAQGAALPIVVGGASPAALRRAATLADAYQSTSTGPDGYEPRIATLREAATAAGRPAPRLGARLRVQLDRPAGQRYSLAGSVGDVAGQLRRFESLGVSEVVLVFDEASPDAFLAAVERFDREVRPLVG